MSPSSSNKKMVQLVNIFSKSEMSLIAVVMEYFIKSGLEYQPESLYYDVSTSIGGFNMVSQLKRKFVNFQ